VVGTARTVYGFISVGGGERSSRAGEGLGLVDFLDLGGMLGDDSFVTP